jgi:guanyl-specific ribonuclease Sa
LKRLLILLFLAIAGLATGARPLSARSQPMATAQVQVPPEARTVLAQVRATGRSFPGYVGGRRFGNYGGGGEQKLPVQDARGRKIAYQEWDIHPKLQGHGRGPERLVTGDDGRGWYTADHYRTFMEVR